MLWYSLEAPRWGASNEYPRHMFSWRNKKDISIFRMKKAPYLLLWGENMFNRGNMDTPEGKADNKFCTQENLSYVSTYADLHIYFHMLYAGGSVVSLIVNV